MNIDFRNQAVLLTEGACGIGLEVALAFARRGATCVLACHALPADNAEVLRRFEQAGAPVPMLLQMDLSQSENLEQKLCELSGRFERIEALIYSGTHSDANTASGSLEEYSRENFLTEIAGGAWGFIDCARGTKRVFGSYPRYLVGLCGTSTLEYQTGADFTAASESALEALCRYMNFHLRDEDARINILRYREAAGAHAFAAPEYSVARSEVANAAIALCSGLMDCMSGHTLTVDRGALFGDNLMRLYSNREQFGL